MARKEQIESVRDYGKKKRRKKIKKISLIIIFFLLLISFFIFLTIQKNKRKYKDYEVVSAIENINDPFVKYISYNSGIIRYTRDGIVAIDSKGELLWNVSYEMQDPIIAYGGSYIAVADRGGKVILIINSSGGTQEISTYHHIADIEIANQGVIAVLMDGGETNYFTVYDAQGGVLVEKEIDISKDGHALGVTLSDDGTKLLTNFVSIKTGELESTLAFYNYGDVGKNFPDGLVGGFKYDNIVIPKVKFIDNNTACAFREDGFTLYSIKERPNEIETIIFEEKIKSIFYNSAYIGCVLEKTGENVKYQLLIYDLQANKILDKDINFDYEKIDLYENEIILYHGLSVLILNLDGSIKFEATFDSNISAIIPSADLDKYFLINHMEIMKIKLTE